MKKLILLAFFGALVLGLQAQNPFAGYKTEKATGVAAHEFGASATVIPLTSDYDHLELRWIGKDGICDPNDYLSFNPSTRRDNIGIGFDFPFAEKTMKYFGLTAGGMLFFGESDLLEPAVNTSTVTSATDYVYFMLGALKSKFSTNYTLEYKSLEAGTDACVRYEKVQDTVFIAYENLQIEDIFGHVLTLSFQYAFDKSGNISFRPVSMTPEEDAIATGDNKGWYYWAYSLGLVSKKPGSDYLLFVQANGTKYTAKNYMDITKASHPTAGESYNFWPGNECVAVASPQVNWDYDVMGTSLVLNPSNAMTWNAEASSTLFILSQENPLTGANLPVNGTVYPNGSTVGSSVFVTTGAYNTFYKRNYFQSDKVDNLEGSTTYYLYAFPYNDQGCGGGPVYNTTNIPKQSFRTNYKEPAYLRVKSVTDKSAELEVAIDAKATRYMLAYDTLQLDPQTDMKIDEPKTYATGEEITFGSRKLRVIEPCGANPEYTLTGLKKGRDYYCYAWSVNAEQDWYSRRVAQCGVAPVRSLPATLNFNAAAAVNFNLENGNLPAGWEEASNNTYEYVVREIHDRKVLSVQCTYQIVGEEQYRPSHSAILSPYINRGESEDGLKATIELVFWALDGNTLITSSIQSTDTVFVECENADGQWQEIARVRAGSGATSLGSGVYTVTIPNFMPKEIFRLRFKIGSYTALPNIKDPQDRTYYFAGISNIRIESLNPEDPDEPVCEPVWFLQVQDGSLTPEGVTLKWFDENNDPAPLEYSVLYKEDAEEEWNVYSTNRTNAQLTGLQTGGSYTAMVRTYCTYVDSSELSTPINFTMPSCGAPTLVTASHIMSTSADLSWNGNGQSYAVIYAPRVGDVKADTLYTEQTSISLTDLIPNTPYSVYVISYCGANHTSPSDPSATAYFNTPVLCTAPRIEVVEGSVTWQSVRIAIHDAPVPDGEILVRSKDTINYYLVYGIGINGRDSITLYGFTDVKNITYVAKARSFCSVDTSDWSESVEFTTLPMPDCGAPSNLQVSVDESGRTATVSWTAGNNNQSWLLMHKERDAQKYDSLPNVRDTSSTFYGLKTNTIYTWRIQASCDRSLYSPLVNGGEFSTVIETHPDCGAPSNLQANVAGRTATVSWTEGENNQSWLLMHKERDAQKYESFEVRKPTSTFTNLKPNTVYTWRVQAVCDNKYSTLVSDEFTTAEASLSSIQFADKLRMRVDANLIEIGNADGVYIKTLEVISMNGKRLKTYTIHSSDNVLIPHTLPFGPAVFRITGEGGQTAVYKLMIK